MNSASLTRFVRSIARLLLLGLSIGSLAAADLAERLQKGLFEEEANQDLNAAIEQYQAIITATDEQRKITATALNRLAECYRKLGKQNQADEVRTRLARDFSEQTQFISDKQAPRAESNPYAAITRLLDNSPDLLNAPNRTNNLSYLQQAAASGNLELMQILLDRGALVDTPITIPPLVLAVRQGHKKAVELLIKAGANVNGKVADGSITPLHEAAGKGFTSITELLTEKGADLGSRDSFGQTALHVAATAGQIQEMQLLLSKGADINAKTFNGATPLISSSQASSAAGTILLVNSNAQVNVKDNTGNNALWFSVLRGLRDCTSALLARNADPNTQDSTGMTVLMLAAQNQDNVTCELLMKAKADVNTIDHTGDTALHRAVSKPNQRIIQLLLEAGANPNIKDNAQKTALDLAVGQNNTGAIKLLLEHGAEVGNAIWTALERPETLKVLLEAKADPNVKTKEGTTLLDYVSRADWRGFKPGLRELLVRYGATNTPSASATNSTSVQGQQK